ncbi:BamA/TamA family outer membrane protein [Neolewinella aurantiaca]|uniref:BamA/TamA family outer membrane protein n=1 Tax=Neolewinella aurantiaca TaxID=2602767 RepID=A0A5C7FFI2_9BACT|nr:ShlB/FhaC/HecB family hemolysin secretion/activation protein [Neolewinella aurantiaca]TXF89028.1 BamA/TamA family outer membrane protein [Neolewinella aurantiaca]
MKLVGIFFLWALALVPGTVEGQGSVNLNIIATDFEPKDSTKIFSDSAAMVVYLKEWIELARAKAHWEASVDSLYRTGKASFTAVLHQGAAYAWAGLTPPDDEAALRWLRRSGFRERRFAAGRPLRPEAWSGIRDSTLVRAANDGYPFAAIGLEDVDLTEPGQLSARISLNTGPLVRIGEVSAPESVRVRPAFLQRYLGLQEGEVYRGQRVRRMAASLNQLPYVTMKGSPLISFQDSLAFFDLPLERKAASRFDFVIGVLPNSAQTGKLLITGELNGELQNGFGQGERIAVRFEQLRPQTQELELGLEYPFLFGLPFGFEGELDLYRRDSSFVNLNWKLAATYLREGNDRLSAFWENRRTIVPGQDLSEEPDIEELPDTLGVVRSFFGLQARRLRTDRRFSPRRGYTIDVSASAGFRRLPAFANLAPDERTSAQAQLQGTAEAFLDPISGSVIYFRLTGAGIFSGEALLASEQYRIGGAKLLRGFDEQSVFARDYAVLTTEFRLLLGGNAFLYGFLDAARVNPRDKSRPELDIDYPIGFGAGINVDTRAGVFGLSLALGKSNGIPLQLDAPKVHLGYVSVF